MCDEDGISKATIARTGEMQAKILSMTEEIQTETCLDEYEALDYLIDIIEDLKETEQ